MCHVSVPSLDGSISMPGAVLSRHHFICALYCDITWNKWKYPHHVRYSLTESSSHSNEQKRFTLNICVTSCNILQSCNHNSAAKGPFACRFPLRPWYPSEYREYETKYDYMCPFVLYGSAAIYVGVPFFMVFRHIPQTGPLTSRFLLQEIFPSWAFMIHLPGYAVNAWPVQIRPFSREHDHFSNELYGECFIWE